MIKHFCFIEALDYTTVDNPNNPFFGLNHQAVVDKFNKDDFDNDDELLHKLFEITLEIAHAAVKFNGMLLASIHPDLYTKDMCLDAIFSKPEATLVALKNEKLLNDEDFVDTCIHQHANCMSVLGDKQNAMLCFKAVAVKAYCVQFVINQTDDICYYALQKDPYCIQYIRKPSMSHYMTAICLNPGVASLIPDKVLVQIVNGLSNKGKIELLTCFIGNRREADSADQQNRLRFIRNDWEVNNIH